MFWIHILYLLPILPYIWELFLRIQCFRFDYWDIEIRSQNYVSVSIETGFYRDFKQKSKISLLFIWDDHWGNYNSYIWGMIGMTKIIKKTFDSCILSI